MGTPMRALQPLVCSLGRLGCRRHLPLLASPLHQLAAPPRRRLHRWQQAADARRRSPSAAQASQAASLSSGSSPAKGLKPDTLSSSSTTTTTGSSCGGVREEQTLRRPHKRQRQERVPFECPACGQNCFRTSVLEHHLQRCCPDVAPAEEWAAVVEGALQEEQPQLAQQAEQQQQDDLEAAIHDWLRSVRRKELALRERALELAFRQRGPGGERLRLGGEEVAAALGLPPARGVALLRAAMRAVPLAADVEPVDVLWEDEDLLAVDKPPWLITAPKHRYTGGSLVNRVIGSLGFEPLTLHRLDMQTSGVVLFGKTSRAVAPIHEQFRMKQVRKQYLALAVGVPKQETFTVDAPIGRDHKEKVARRVDPYGKPAVTRFTVLASASAADLSSGELGICVPPGVALPREGLSLISCSPLTGRTHQIRVHLAHAGHPILGDDLYGITGSWIPRQALHAARLDLTHPVSGEPLRVAAPVPRDFLRAMQLLGLQPPAGGQQQGRLEE